MFISPSIFMLFNRILFDRTMYATWSTGTLTLVARLLIKPTSYLLKRSFGR